MNAWRLCPMATIIAVFGCTGGATQMASDAGIGPDGPSTSGRPSNADRCRPLFADGGLGVDVGDARVSFRADLVPLFGQRCTFGGCHDGRETTGQLRLGDECTYDPSK